MSDKNSRQPLEGINVADFSWFAAGPICSEIMALYGANVVRVESETHIDGIRAVGPFPRGKTGYNVSGYFNNYNVNKQSITIDLNTEKGRDLARRLVAWSDVFLSNMTPRIIDRWGLTYDELRAIRPDIIAAYQPMQGLDGPHRDFLGFGAVLTPITGFNHLTGFPNRAPGGLGTNYPDYVVNPGHTLIAILAALRYRKRTGKGQRVELSQLESSAAVLAPALLDYTNNGRSQTRSGNRLPHAAPHGAFPCQTIKVPGVFGEQDEQRWCVIACFSDGQWSNLRAVIDSDWARDDRFATHAGRKQHEDELEQKLGEWTSERSPEEVTETLQAAGVPAAVVQNARDCLDADPHLREREYYVYLDHPETGHSAYDGPGFRLSKTPAQFRTAAPCLGEHTHQVCKDILGLSDEEIAELVAEQVLY